MDSNVIKDILSAVDAKNGDLVFFSADHKDIVNSSMSALIKKLGSKLNLLNNEWKFKEINNNIIAKIESIDDIEDIKSFGKKDIYILKSELPELETNEAYWFELVGMNVINLEGQHLGRVDEVNNYGANDILVVKPMKKQIKNILIPFIKNRVIISVEKSKNSILVDWQEDY